MSIRAWFDWKLKWNFLKYRNFYCFGGEGRGGTGKERAKKFTKFRQKVTENVVKFFIFLILFKSWNYFFGSHLDIQTKSHKIRIFSFFNFFNPGFFFPIWDCATKSFNTILEYFVGFLNMSTKSHEMFSNFLIF